MQLVDEEHDLALGLLHFLDEALEALLKLAPVLGARHQGPHVQAHDPQALEALGHVPLVDALGQALHDGSLAHAGFADEYGVVLGAPGEHLQHPADLLVPADDRVQLACGGQGRVVLGVLLQTGELLLGLVVLHLGALAPLADGGFQLLAIQAEALQQGLGVRVGVAEGQQESIRGQEAVAEAAGRVTGHFQEVPEGRARLGFGAAHGPGQLGHQGLGPLGQSFKGLGTQARPLQQGPQPRFRRQKGQEEMLGHQLWSLILQGPLPGGNQSFIGFLG